ncbi:VP91 [Plodia interpunctella granulovirus]|uniref:VP91 n=1 Tax=Plodia interpunctella granulovirus TaxID=262175 RepID=A0A1L5JGR0_9BBAC|nr:VP91 [Plodia interpunctella granulovirus]APO13972.1 VP91 [Plodia interpunctella granulovirus]
MLSVSTMLFVIILLGAVLLFYNYLIITDFDTDSFTARLGVLTEYLRTVGDNVVPNIIGYVSHVNDNNYIVSYFYTDSLKLHETVAKNEFEEQFDFASQSFVRKRSDDTTASVSFVGNDIRKFVAHADDGDVVMDCGNGLFDGTSCAPEPICNAPNRKLPLTEDNLNELVFNRMAAKPKPLLHTEEHHPTAYIQCDGNSVPHIEECVSGETFVHDRCVYDPPLTTNGQGLVTFVDFSRPSYKISRIKIETRHYGNEPVNYGDEVAHDDESTLEIEDFTKKELEFDLMEPDIVITKMTKKLFYPMENASKFNKRAPPPSSMMIPVNAKFPYDHTPCLNADVGHTFVSSRIAKTQYFECLTGNNLFLHSCNSVLYDGSKHSCDVEKDCLQFENGTGEILNSIQTDNLLFDTGKSSCVDFKVQEIVECDTGDFVADKKFDHPLEVVFGVSLPREIFTDRCVEYDNRSVTVLRDAFDVTVTYHPEFSNSMIGRISKIESRAMLEKESLMSKFVTYSRDLGEICNESCFNLDCKTPDGLTVDILDNTKYNVCEEGKLVEEVTLEPDEYIENGQVKRLENYNGECRFEHSVDYFDIPYREVSGFSCAFTVPKLIL